MIFYINYLNYIKEIYFCHFWATKNRGLVSAPLRKDCLAKLFAIEFGWIYANTSISSVRTFIWRA